MNIKKLIKGNKRFRKAKFTKYKETNQIYV